MVNATISKLFTRIDYSHYKSNPSNRRCRNCRDKAVLFIMHPNSHVILSAPEFYKHVNRKKIVPKHFSGKEVTKFTVTFKSLSALLLWLLSFFFGAKVMRVLWCDSKATFIINEGKKKMNWLTGLCQFKDTCNVDIIKTVRQTQTLLICIPAACISLAWVSRNGRVHEINCARKKSH